MKTLLRKSLPLLGIFLLGLCLGLILDAPRSEAGLFDKLNFKVVDDLKSMGKSLKQMDEDIRSLQKDMEEIRESRERIGKRLGLSDALKEDDEKDDD